MDWSEILAKVGAALNFELVNVAGTTITGATLLSAVLIVLISMWVSRLGQRAIGRVFAIRGVKVEGTVGVFKRLTHYLILAIGFGVALSTLGIDLGALFAAGAIFAVGIGFAMQNIAQNFVSGLILLIEHSIKPGDVVEVESTIVKVKRMGIRATVVRTLQDEDVIVPNSILVQNAVKNYTLADSFYRIRVAVGVIYGSNMKDVMEVLQKAAESVDWRDASHTPRVQMVDFGTSSVDFDVSVWVDDPWQLREYGSQLRQAIWWALKDAEITIAFPQVDVHFDPPVEGALAKLGSAA
jgi:small-conductance mechanosensitive channel